MREPERGERKRRGTGTPLREKGGERQRERERGREK